MKTPRRRNNSESGKCFGMNYLFLRKSKSELEQIKQIKRA